MFYNTEMLTKRGPLARVWMASHLSTKLNKTALLSTSIPSSVTSILGQDLLPMALRLSGQLLLGVARIYSRKAKYLLDDCNETLAKVKKAFGRPGAVDLDEGEQRGRDAITLRTEQGGLDDILGYNDGEWGMDFNAAPAAGPLGVNKGKGKANFAGATADIDLPPQAHEFDLGGYGDLDDDEPMYDLGPDGALVFDLGLDDLLGMDDEDEVGRGRKRSASAMTGEDDVELGRRDDGPNASDRGASVFSNNDFGGGDEVGLDKDGEQIDLGLGDDGDMGGFEQFDFGGGDEVFGDRERTPQAHGHAPAVEDDDAARLTPKTAADLVAKKEVKSSGNKKQKLKKQVVDRVTELDWEQGSKAAAEAKKELLFTEAHYLPRSRTHLRLLERAADPSYYLPKPLDATGNMYLFAPPGLAAPLQQLFKFSSRRALIKAQGRERSPDVAVEAGRRLASPSPMDFNNDFGGGDETFGADAGMQVDDAFGEDLGGHDDFQFDIPDADPAAEERVKASKANAERLREEHDRRVERSAADDNGLENAQNATSEGALAVFDQASATATQQSQSQAHTQADEDEDAERAKGNWSKNTMKAVTVLRDAVNDEGESVTFEKVADGASRRAAASFFFELLVLSTRDCIAVQQSTPYGEIDVTPKEKLFSPVVANAVAA